MHNQDATDFWTFKICDLKSCKQHYNHGYPSKDLHLIIERQEVGREELLANPGQYFAISYTWGKLPFKKHYLGHSPDGDRAFVLELGQEWDRKGVVETLARLSCGEENTGGVKLRAGWLDQFRTRSKSPFASGIIGKYLTLRKTRNAHTKTRVPRYRPKSST